MSLASYQAAPPRDSVLFADVAISTDCDRYLLGVKSHRLLPRARDGASYRQTSGLPVTFSSDSRLPKAKNPQHKRTPAAPDDGQIQYPQALCDSYSAARRRKSHDPVPIQTETAAIGTTLGSTMPFDCQRCNPAAQRPRETSRTMVTRASD